MELKQKAVARVAMARETAGVRVEEVDVVGEESVVAAAGEPTRMP